MTEVGADLQITGTQCSYDSSVVRFTSLKRVISVNQQPPQEPTPGTVVRRVLLPLFVDLAPREVHVLDPDHLRLVDKLVAEREQEEERLSSTVSYVRTKLFRDGAGDSR